MYYIFCFFFSSRRRHTRWPRDWSSDVCSSDLKIIIELKSAGKTILFSTHRMEQVEQMCDDICLFNNGKVVLTGNLRQVKKDFGKNTVLLEFEGDPSFLDHLENVRMNNRSNNFAEIRLLNDQDPQSILVKAMESVQIQRFQLVEPSLNEIFISTVGEDNIKNMEVLTN